MEKDDKKTMIECWTFINGVLVGHDVQKKVLEGVSAENDPIYQGLLKNIGIGPVHPMYIKVNEIQDKDDEYKKIIRFLNRYLEYYAKNNNMEVSDLNIKFINYGRTELVYVLTDKNDKRLTLLVKQPEVRFGDVYQEMQYLSELSKKDKNVIEPIDYYSLGDQELYVTPYINQTRCVASCEAWGMYIPEPYYRFEPFTNEQESIVNICMISKLVSLYDFDKQEGISCCKLGGGDFMLIKGWENETPTIENTLSQLYLVAARKKVKCSFEEYLQIIRSEFSRATFREEQSQLIINLRGREPMQISDIEAGIILGMSFIDKQDNHSLVLR